MVAIASVVLVITPISWILLHQPQNDPADASVPIVTRTDDTYITPTTKPVVAPPTARPSTPPTATPTATPTPTPTDSATPTETPSTAGPTDDPTASPTKDGKTTEPTTAPTSPDRTVSTKRPTTPTDHHRTAAAAARGGRRMNADELQLFNLIDNARVSNGCARLEQDPGLTDGARADAGNRAKSGAVNSTGSSGTTAGGDNWSAQQAFNQMMAQSRSTVLNCGLTTLGVGAPASPQHCDACWPCSASNGRPQRVGGRLLIGPADFRAGLVRPWVDGSWSTYLRRLDVRGT